MSFYARRPGLFRRVFRPGLLAAFGLVFILGGCVAIELAARGPAQPTSGTGTTAAPPAGGAPAQRPPNTPTWTGTLRVTDQGINMTAPQPAVDTIGGSATIGYYGPWQTLRVDEGGQGPAAVWTSPTDPTYEQCAQLVQTQPLSQAEMARFPYRKGQGLCIVAGDSAMAFVRGVNAPGSDAVQMHALRWPLVAN